MLDGPQGRGYNKEQPAARPTLSVERTAGRDKLNYSWLDYAGLVVRRPESVIRYVGERSLGGGRNAREGINPLVAVGAAQNVFAA